MKKEKISPEELRNKHVDWKVIMETLNWAEKQLAIPRNSKEACLALERDRKEKIPPIL